MAYQWYSINIAKSSSHSSRNSTQLKQLTATLFTNAWAYPHPQDNLNVSYSIFRLNILALSSTMRQTTLTPTYHSMTSPCLLHAEGAIKKNTDIKTYYIFICKGLPCEPSLKVCLRTRLTNWQLIGELKLSSQHCVTICDSGTCQGRGFPHTLTGENVFT